MELVVQPRRRSMDKLLIIFIYEWIRFVTNRALLSRPNLEHAVAHLTALHL